MLALIVATVFIAGFGIVVRDSQRRGLDLFTVGLVNYLTASAFYAVWSLHAGLLTCDPRTTAIGAVGGLVYGGGFLLMLGPMRWRGLGIVSALLGLSALIPMGASLIIWREAVGPVQVAGVVLALLALPLLGLDQGVIRLRLTWRMGLALAGLFLVNGAALSVQKWYHTTGLSAERPAFLLWLFGVAAAPLCLAWARQSRRLSAAGVGWGAMLGTCNVLGNLALLGSLDHMPGTVVFPVLQAGIMVVSAAFAAVAWRELPGRPGAVGIAVGAAAVVLINLG